MNINLFIFTSLLLMKTIYIKYLNYQYYQGSTYWLKLKRTTIKLLSADQQKKTLVLISKPFIMNLFVLSLMLLAAWTAWKLFTSNSVHNFICLFYP